MKFQVKSNIQNELLKALIFIHSSKLHAVIVISGML